MFVVQSPDDMNQRFVPRKPVGFQALGDFDTLPDRIQAEIAASNTMVSFVPMMGAWSRKSKSNGY